MIEKKAKQKLSAPEPVTFQEKNFLKGDALFNRARSRSPPKKMTNLRRKSFGAKKSSTMSYTTLEEEIKQLNLKNQKSTESEPSDLAKAKSSNGAHSAASSGNKNGHIEPISFKPRAGGNTFESRLAQIGKLDSKKLDLPLTPNRSSTPDENLNK